MEKKLQKMEEKILAEKQEYQERYGKRLMKLLPEARALKEKIESNEKKYWEFKSQLSELERRRENGQQLEKRNRSAKGHGAGKGSGIDQQHRR